MKISILAIAAFFFVSLAFADGAPLFSVKINSFVRIGNEPTITIAELCGVVTVTDPVAMPKIGNLIPVTITSDPDTNNPGRYSVLADQNGNFCALINTYTGNASAEAWLPHGGSSAASGVVPVGTARH